jgi:predicted Zn-dependent peptidase
MAAAGTDPANVDEVIQIMDREVRRLADEPLSDEDLTNAKAYLDGSLVVGLETFSAQAFQMIRDETYGVRVLSQAHRDGIQRVTTDDVQRVATQYLRPDGATLVVIRP